ncbi:MULTISPECIES: 2-keto-4-pentenoate hydratase [unclassified Sphingomonas]|uniref:2-keto-4-pentenoate hydratase n=1 Tax=unclassified Sphingomonas TaxID=196159 RepID=UPI0006F41B4C|nr:MULTISPECIES: 2-keto-4-pentenoate hydratase [unclassified Sphingomonas]KQM29007.1 2-keto-4-pentenoate hydratase [Sphingomonas sp. Leaf9]KQM45708.1 2-keto-4-pentenoate hydratase [Sphingomonas sp. Leaf11]
MGNRDRIAQAFVTARQQAAGLSPYPGEPPMTLAEAYAIQDRAIAIDGRVAAGWKVGRINAPLDATLGVNRLAGPIFADQIFGAETATMAVIADGFAAAEAEYCVRIGRAPEAGRTALSLDEALALVDAVHIGVEIASSPYAGINADGPLVTISDFGNNFGLLIGAEVPGWRELGFLDWPVESRIDDAVVGSATARAMLDGPIGAVAFLVDCLAARGQALMPGTWVSSGAVTGVHQIRPGQRFEADFGVQHVRCGIVAAAGNADTGRTPAQAGGQG